MVAATRTQVPCLDDTVRAKVAEDVVDATAHGTRKRLVQPPLQVLDGLRFAVGIEVTNQDDHIARQCVALDYLKQVVRGGWATTPPTRVDWQGTMVVHEEDLPAGLLVLQSHPLGRPIPELVLGNIDQALAQQLPTARQVCHADGAGPGPIACEDAILIVQSSIL